MPFVHLDSLGGLTNVACVVYAEFHGEENLIPEARLSYHLDDAMPGFLEELGVETESWRAFLCECLSMKPEMQTYIGRRIQLGDAKEGPSGKHRCCRLFGRKKQQLPEECLHHAAHLVWSWSEKWPRVTVQHHVYDELGGRYIIMFRDGGQAFTMKQFDFTVPEGSADLGAFMLLGSADRLEDDLKPLHLVKVLTAESHRSRNQRKTVQSRMSIRSASSASSSVSELSSLPVVVKVASKAAKDGLRDRDGRTSPAGKCISFSMEDEVKMTPSNKI
eukprot:TRINITY_DN80982_c0_g1_i1.p1 TRINITY_DN80982_c0_g1~~TRINITY_DN80982_c0_g1_i1.p1  ORF type:complete len:275 (-),score=27.80 TRINITY_DN80982_c0_g1_i1:42-866(-)